MMADRARATLDIEDQRAAITMMVHICATVIPANGVTLGRPLHIHWARGAHSYIHSHSEGHRTERDSWFKRILHTQLAPTMKAEHLWKS